MTAPETVSPPKSAATPKRRSRAKRMTLALIGIPLSMAAVLAIGNYVTERQEAEQKRIDEAQFKAKQAIEEKENEARMAAYAAKKEQMAKDLSAFSRTKFRDGSTWIPFTPAVDADGRGSLSVLKDDLLPPQNGITSVEVTTNYVSSRSWADLMEPVISLDYQATVDCRNRIWAYTHIRAIGESGAQIADRDVGQLEWKSTNYTYPMRRIVLMLCKYDDPDPDMAPIPSVAATRAAAADRLKALFSSSPHATVWGAPWHSFGVEKDENNVAFTGYVREDTLSPPPGNVALVETLRILLTPVAIAPRMPALTGTYRETKINCADMTYTDVVFDGLRSGNADPISLPITLTNIAISQDQVTQHVADLICK
jgi:hypothetical protein